MAPGAAWDPDSKSAFDYLIWDELILLVNLSPSKSWVGTESAGPLFLWVNRYNVILLAS